MPPIPVLCLVIVVSYLVGAIPFGYLLARARGLDILSQGSGNIGATNVARVLGKPFGVLVFLLDFAKGAIPTLAAGWVTLSDEAAFLPGTLPVAAGIAAFLGHLFPIYLRFRGGKGVATGAGVIAVLVPLITVIVFAVWVVVFVLTRYVSLASLTAAALLFVLRLVLTPAPWDQTSLVVTLFCLAGSCLVFLRHHGNIRRLLAGTENRV
jgi:acyl-phosphate glycerol 3-phosphate acyltransferase